MQCSFELTGTMRETAHGTQRRARCRLCRGEVWTFAQDMEQVRAACRGRPLLGDRLASFFARLRIRKQPGCGCERRRAVLNRWHLALQAFWR